MQRLAFRAMGTEVELLVDAERADRSLDAAEREFHRLEQVFSRFRPDSELSLLNAERRLVAGPDLVRVVELALDARERTGGRFDPTIHDALVAAGYDRSFELVPSETDGWAGMHMHMDTHAHRPMGIHVTPDGRVELEDGVRIDLGGIAKGYAAERAAELLALAGPCLVNAGGDVATRGGSWPIGVETADGPLTLELSGGSALATSGSDRRRWRRNGRDLHHIIDPRTGEPAETDLLRVTVVAADAVEAEVAAKALFLAGSDAAVAEADDTPTPTVLVTADGRTLLAGGLA